MLSRVAQRVYWIGRYMERSENIARIINVNSNLLFDLPPGTKIGWLTLIEILGNQEDYLSRKNAVDERNIMKYLLVDKLNPSSLINTLYMLRENIRTTREVLPADAWEQINQLYHFLKNDLSDNLSRKRRFIMLQDVISTSQRFTGMLSSTMSNNHAYEFVRIGRNLERADMTSRILDMGCNNLLPDDSSEKKQNELTLQYQPTLWMSILVSLSADQSYRQNIQNKVNNKDVVEYLLKDNEFPRAVMHCLRQLLICLNNLPDSKNIIILVNNLIDKIEKKKFNRNLDSSLSKFLDQIQLHIADTSNSIESKWFLS